MKSFGQLTRPELAYDSPLEKPRPGLPTARLSGKNLRLLGPAPAGAKIMRQELERLGVKEREMPKQLKDKIVAKSRPGPLGQVQLRYLSGLANNVAKRAVDQFEENTQGRDDIIEKLEAAKDMLSGGEKLLLEMLKNPTLGRRTLARLVAESGAEPTSLMKGYAKGAMLLGKMKAAIWAHNALPRVVKDLIGHAIDSDAMCGTCVGLGKIGHHPSGGKFEKSLQKNDKECPTCKGTGIEKVSSEHKKFAAEKLLEIGEMLGKSGPLVQVNTQVNTASAGAGLSEKILNAAEAILRRQVSSEVVDAEVVPPTPPAEPES